MSLDRLPLPPLSSRLLCSWPPPACRREPAGLNSTTLCLRHASPCDPRSTIRLVYDDCGCSVDHSRHLPRGDVTVPPSCSLQQCPDRKCSVWLNTVTSEPYYFSINTRHTSVWEVTIWLVDDVTGWASCSVNVSRLLAGMREGGESQAGSRRVSGAGL